MSVGENANYRAKFALLKSKQARFPKTKNGEYMIAVSDIYDYSLDGVENVIVYAKGTIDNPIITKVLRIDLYEESKTLDRRRREYYDAGRRGLQPKAGELCRFNYRTDAVSYEQYERNQFANNRHNGKFGINGETSGGKASQAKGIGRTEEGHIIYYHEDTQELSQNRIETPDPSTILKEVIHSKVGLKQYGKYTESLKKYQDLDVRVRNQEKRISEIDAEIAKLKSDKKQSGKGTRMNELHRMRKTAYLKISGIFTSIT